MSELEDEGSNDSGNGLLCPECGEQFESPMRLGLHRKNEHGVAGQSKKPTGRPRGRPPGSKNSPRLPSRGSLRGQIKDAVLMTSAVISISDPLIYMAVEATVDEFATAWDNVAKTSPTARKYIEGLLVGGVWISAVGATVVMVVTVAAVTGKLSPGLQPLGAFCLGKANLRIVPQQPPEDPDGMGERVAA